MEALLEDGGRLVRPCLYSFFLGSRFPLSLSASQERLIREAGVDDVALKMASLADSVVCCLRCDGAVDEHVAAMEKKHASLSDALSVNSALSGVYVCRPVFDFLLFVSNKLWCSRQDNPRPKVVDDVFQLCRKLQAKHEVRSVGGARV